MPLHIKISLYNTFMSSFHSSPPPLLPEAVLEKAATALKVLAHPHRLRMVELLLRQRHSVGELAEATGLPAAAVSQHLSKMRAHGLLDVEHQGRLAYYQVVHPSARNCIACLQEHRHDLLR